MSSRLSGRVLTWFYLILWVSLLFVWAWSTGWRNYLIPEDIPTLLLLILALLFISWLDARHKILYGPGPSRAVNSLNPSDSLTT